MLKSYIRKALLGYKASNDDYLNYLKDKGAKIGGGVYIYSPNHTYIDVQFPWMLEIGDEVRITTGVTILNHDYSWSVWKSLTGEIVGGVGKVKIGNNVFIGMNATILMNTDIGDNVIIGAGSVVSGKVDSNSVYAGTPARKIMSLEEYINKRKKRELDDAKEIARNYYERFNKKPTKDTLPAYFWLFESDEDSLIPIFKERMKLCGNYEQSITAFKKHKAVYRNYEEFLEDALQKE